MYEKTRDLVRVFLHRVENNKVFAFRDVRNRHNISYLQEQMNLYQKQNAKRKRILCTYHRKQRMSALSSYYGSIFLKIIKSAIQGRNNFCLKSMGFFGCSDPEIFYLAPLMQDKLLLPGYLFLRSPLISILFIKCRYFQWTRSSNIWQWGLFGRKFLWQLH